MEIENIKDAVYELEGLLELAELREDKLPALLPLMKNKLDTINSLFADLRPEISEKPDLTDESELEEEMELSETVEVADNSEGTESVGQQEEENSPAIYNTPDDEDDEVFVPLISPLIQDEAETDIEVPTIPVVPQDISDEEVVETETVTETYSEDFSSSYGAEYEIPDDDDEEIVTTHTKEETHRAAHDPNLPKPAFCINDRFRFRRELFGNSDTEFSAAMDLVATMEDYDEAEAYFFAERGWNPEQPEVMDFMAIIRNYFEK